MGGTAHPENIRFIAQIADVVTPRTPVRAITTDPDDNRILECALEGRADVIVSNDHHLLDVRAFQGIPVIAAPDFRRTLGLK
jgi:predicted nucleic acid-binding protein